jgi:hypothetical protein
LQVKVAGPDPARAGLLKMFKIRIAAAMYFRGLIIVVRFLLERA